MQFLFVLKTDKLAQWYFFLIPLYVIYSKNKVLIRIVFLSFFGQSCDELKFLLNIWLNAYDFF